MGIPRLPIFGFSISSLDWIIRSSVTVWFSPQSFSLLFLCKFVYSTVRAKTDWMLATAFSHASIKLPFSLIYQPSNNDENKSPVPINYN